MRASAVLFISGRATAGPVLSGALLSGALIASVACGGAASPPGASASRLAPPATATAPLDGASFAIRDVRVFDGERALEHTSVVVRAGRITAVGREVPRDLPVIDGRGRTLMPGLIDAHAHVQSEAGLRNALRFGVTTQLDMMTDVAFLQAHRAQRERWSRTDLADLFSAGTPATSPGGMGTQFGIAVPTLAGPSEAPAFVRARLAEGSSYIKIMHEPDGRIVTTISRETLAAVIAAAHEQHVLTAVHVSSQQGAREAVEAGADGLAHIFSDAVIDDALVARIAAQHMFVTATLSIMAAFDGQSLGPQLAADPRIAPFLTDKQRKQLTGAPPGKDDPMAPYLARFHIATAIENVRRLHAAGVTILAGDDAANLGAHGATMHGELVLLTRAGLTPAEALRAATRAPADRFGLTDRGRIAPGARADLILIEGNPLVDIEATRAIARIFKNGYEVPRAPK
jgi:imidazolonepropionase-like amidohydrolase